MVNAQVENVSQTKKKISISVPKDRVNKYFQKAYQKVGGKAKIKGFRPGKVPQNMLDRMYGMEIHQECLSFLVDETYPEAMYSHNIVPVAQPDFQINPINKNADYNYVVEVEVKPDFELKDYQSLQIKKQEVEVKPEDIEKELRSIQENMAELESAEGESEIKDGLVATIDFEGKINGKPFEGGTSQDYMLQYGKGQFLEDFEKQMKGMKIGEERVVKITFSEDYFQKQVAGKEAEFQVKLKSLHHKKLPEIDDELAKDIGKKDLNELKSEIEKLVKESKEAAFRNDYAGELRKQILEQYDFEVPKGLIDAEVKNSKRDRKEIEEQIKYELVLEAIAVKENLKPEPQDIDQRLATYAQIYRKPLAEIKKMFLSQNMLPHLMSGIMIDKAVDFLIENAKKV